MSEPLPQVCVYVWRRMASRLFLQGLIVCLYRLVSLTLTKKRFVSCSTMRCLPTYFSQFPPQWSKVTTVFSIQK